MRKWVIGVGIGVVAIGLVAGGAAFAATRDTDRTAALEAGDNAYLPFMGRMGAFNQGGVGLRGIAGNLHGYVFQAVAESLNLSAEDLEAKLRDGQSLTEIAKEQGVAEDEMPSLLKEAQSKALQAAVDDGVLTQAQADWMKDHPALQRMLEGGRMRGGWGMRSPRGMMGWGSFGPR